MYLSIRRKKKDPDIILTFRVNLKNRTTKTKLLTTPEREELKKKCESIIGEGRISHDRMRHALEGSDILQKYSFSQIRTRLKY